MKKGITIALGAAVIVGLGVFFWQSQTGGRDGGSRGEVETSPGSRSGGAVASPVRLGADDGADETEEERYLEAREELAREGAREIRESHQPSAYVDDPSKDYSMTIPALRKARDAYKAGNMEEALAGFEAVIAADPTKTSARHYAVEVACILGEEAVARKHVAELSESRQRMLAEQCDKQGVTLPGIEWTPGGSDD